MNPVGSVGLALKVTWMFQLSVTVPCVSVHARPASHTPLAVGPEPL